MSVIEGLPANQDMLGEPVTDFELSPGFPVPPAERPLPAFDARYGWRPTVEPDGLVFAGIIRSRRTAPQGVVGTWTPAEIAPGEREEVEFYTELLQLAGLPVEQSGQIVAELLSGQPDDDVTSPALAVARDSSPAAAKASQLPWDIPMRPALTVSHPDPALALVSTQYTTEAFSLLRPWPAEDEPLITTPPPGAPPEPESEPPATARQLPAVVPSEVEPEPESEPTTMPRRPNHFQSDENSGVDQAQDHQPASGAPTVYLPRTYRLVDIAQPQSDPDQTRRLLPVGLGSPLAAARALGAGAGAAEITRVFAAVVKTVEGKLA